MTSSKTDRFGIGVMKYCRAHEKALQKALEEGRDPQELLAWHLEKLRWMQHERLIHLLVTLLTAIAFLFVVFLELCFRFAGVFWLLVLLLAGLLLAYLIHYFRLENTVQHWYKLADELREKIHEDKK